MVQDRSGLVQGRSQDMMKLSDPQLTLLAVGFDLIAALAIVLICNRLANRHGGDVRVVWYLFSLSVVCTLVAALWATDIGAIDAVGVFQGRWGAMINWLLKFMLDLETDLKIFAALLAIFVAPQMANYLLSGLFGCASAPIFVGKAFGFFIWSVVKSFVVASGILSTVSIYGWAHGWMEWSVKGAVSMLLLSLMLLSMSFWILHVYRDVGGDEAAKSLAPRALRVQRFFGRLHVWFTRKSAGVDRA